MAAGKDRHMSINWTELAGEVKGARKAAMPKQVTPMLATLVDKPFTSQ